MIGMNRTETLLARGHGYSHDVAAVYAAAVGSRGCRRGVRDHRVSPGTVLATNRCWGTIPLGLGSRGTRQRPHRRSRNGEASLVLLLSTTRKGLGGCLGPRKGLGRRHECDGSIDHLALGSSNKNGTAVSSATVIAARKRLAVEAPTVLHFSLHIHWNQLEKGLFETLSSTSHALATLQPSGGQLGFGNHRTRAVEIRSEVVHG